MYDLVSFIRHLQAGREKKTRVCSSQHRYHKDFWSPWLHRARTPLSLQECLHQGGAWWKEKVGKRERISNQPSQLGHRNGCRTDAGCRTFGLICENLCNFFFLCYTTYKSPNYKLTLCDRWCNEQFLWGFLFLSGKGEGKEQGIVLLFICILVPKCKYNFLCYFFVVTTKMNILIR